MRAACPRSLHEIRHLEHAEFWRDRSHHGRKARRGRRCRASASSAIRRRCPAGSSRRPRPWPCRRASRSRPSRKVRPTARTTSPASPTWPNLISVCAEAAPAKRARPAANDNTDFSFDICSSQSIQSCVGRLCRRLFLGIHCGSGGRGSQPKRMMRRQMFLGGDHDRSHVGGGTDDCFRGTQARARREDEAARCLRARRSRRAQGLWRRGRHEPQAL